MRNDFHARLRLSVVSVCQTGVLPAASFGFHLAMDALAERTNKKGCGTGGTAARESTLAYQNLM